MARNGQTMMRQYILAKLTGNGERLDVGRCCYHVSSSGRKYYLIVGLGRKVRGKGTDTVNVTPIYHDFGKTMGRAETVQLRPLDASDHPNFETVLDSMGYFLEASLYYFLKANYD